MFRPFVRESCLALSVLCVCLFIGGCGSGAAANGSCASASCTKIVATDPFCSFNATNGKCDHRDDNCTKKATASPAVTCLCHDGMVSGKFSCLCHTHGNFNL